MTKGWDEVRSVTARLIDGKARDITFLKYEYPKKLVGKMEELLLLKKFQL